MKKNLLLLTFFFYSIGAVFAGQPADFSTLSSSNLEKEKKVGLELLRRVVAIRDRLKNGDVVLEGQSLADDVKRLQEWKNNLYDQLNQLERERTATTVHSWLISKEKMNRRVFLLILGGVAVGLSAVGLVKWHYSLKRRKNNADQQERDLQALRADIEQIGQGGPTQEEFDRMRQQRDEARQGLAQIDQGALQLQGLLGM